MQMMIINIFASSKCLSSCDGQMSEERTMLMGQNMAARAWAEINVPAGAITSPRTRVTQRLVGLGHGRRIAFYPASGADHPRELIRRIGFPRKSQASPCTASRRVGHLATAGRGDLGEGVRKTSSSSSSTRTPISPTTRFLFPT